MHQAVYRCGELALKGSQGAPDCLARPRIDNIGDTFRLSKVNLVIEKGAQGKLTGVGEASACSQATGQHEIGYSRTPVALQLQHIFSCVGLGRAEIKSDALVDRCPVLVQKFA
jgi:hypothetical protein